MEWSEVGWAGWRGVEWSGVGMGWGLVEWRGAAWRGVELEWSRVEWRNSGAG